MNVKYQFISKPDDNTIRIIRGKMRPDQRKAMDEFGEEGVGAVLLVQGSIPDMLYCADIAVKASDVGAYEIVGNCPSSRSASWARSVRYRPHSRRFSTKRITRAAKRSWPASNKHGVCLSRQKIRLKVHPSAYFYARFHR